MLVSVLFIALAVAAIQWYSLNRSFRDLSAGSTPETDSAECGEVFTLKTELRNSGWFPLFFLRVREYVPREAEFPQDPQIKEGTGAIDQVMYVLSRQKVTRTLPVCISRRGRVLFGSVRVSAGDFLGLDSRSKQYRDMKEVVIWPRPADIRSWIPQADDYLGSVSVQRFILPDPIETIGYRDYTGREPMKDIHWPKSLSSGRLTVRQYDHFTDLSACVITDISDGTPQGIEHAYSVTRSIADMLAEKKIPFSFHTNAFVLSEGTMSSRVMSGIGDAHRKKVLDILGRATYERTMGTGSLIREAAGSRDVQKAYLLVSAGKPDAELIRRAERRYGIRILIYKGEEDHETETVD